MGAIQSDCCISLDPKIEKLGCNMRHYRAHIPGNTNFKMKTDDVKAMSKRKLDQLNKY